MQRLFQFIYRGHQEVDDVLIKLMYQFVISYSEIVYEVLLKMIIVFLLGCHAMKSLVHQLRSVKVSTYTTSIN